MTEVQDSMPRDSSAAEAPDVTMFRRFPPHVLRQYAMIADGQRGAICGPDGDISWLCASQWHDDAVFSALLGGRGIYSVAPDEPFVWGGRYENGTLIWRDRWITTSGIVECREALYYPGDPHRLILLRRVEAVGHTTRFTVTLDARAGFGEHPMRNLTKDDSGRWTAQTGNLWLRWSGCPDAGVSDDELHAEFSVSAGESRDLVLEISDERLPEPVDPERAWQATANAWDLVMPACDNTIAPTDSRHAFAVLRGMTRPGGGMAAAATTSLPERAEAGSNFDYRFSWIRDQSYAGIAAAAAGTYGLLDDAVAFVSARLLEDGPALSPAYLVTGQPVPEQVELALPGYPGAQTVMRGNHVTDQFQLDAYGEALQLLAAAGELDRLDAAGWRAVGTAYKAIAKLWQRAEAGIWELGDDWWTQSRLGCVAGLRWAARVTHTAGDAAQMVTLADTILAETTRRCLHPTGYWQRNPHDSGVDGSLLLPPVRGALPADDPRTQATLRAARQQLFAEGYVYRFPQAPHPLGDVEGAFLLCGFAMSLAEWHQGANLEAFRLFERNRSASGPPALLSEEYDVGQKQLRGNLPQAFVHAGLLETAARLAGAPHHQDQHFDR